MKNKSYEDFIVKEGTRMFPNPSYSSIEDLRLCKWGE